MSMSREEHLQWCKERALAYCDREDYRGAWASMCSDLGKHPETKGHPDIALGMQQLLRCMALNNAASMRRFIEGFR